MVIKLRHFKTIKSSFKKTINCNKYQSTVSIEKQNQYSDYLIGPSFQGVNRLFNAYRTRHSGYFLPKVEIKDYIQCYD